MHKKDTKTLEKLFSHPISMNLEWNEVKHMLETMGVEVETTHHNHTKIHYGEESMSFKINRHALNLYGLCKNCQTKIVNLQILLFFHA